MASLKDVARLKRDVPKASSLLDDTQIGQILDEHGKYNLAVAHVYDILAADASSKGNIQVGRYKESFVSQADSYRFIANSWRKKSGHKGYAGGISKSDVETRELDDDRVQTKIKKGIDSATD